jgi:hypothetical protein
LKAALSGRTRAEFRGYDKPGGALDAAHPYNAAKQNAAKIEYIARINTSRGD